MNGIIETFLLAMTPIGELRAAIPVGIAVYRLHWLVVYFVAVIGNLIPAVLLLLFLRPVSNWLSQKFKIFDRFFYWLFARARSRVGDRIQKRGGLALALFVAIPLPITGVWTGSVVAFLFNIPLKKAFPAVVIGVALAGVIVTALTLSGVAIEKYLGWPALLITIAVIAVGFVLKFRIKHSIKI